MAEIKFYPLNFVHHAALCYVCASLFSSTYWGRNSSENILLRRFGFSAGDSCTCDKLIALQVCQTLEIAKGRVAIFYPASAAHCTFQYHVYRQVLCFGKKKM